jgi:hypothetical protein
MSVNFQLQKKRAATLIFAGSESATSALLARKLNCHCPGDCDSVVHDVHTEVATNVCHPFAAMKYRCCRHNESTNRRGAHVSIFTRPSISQSWNRASRDNNSTGVIQTAVLSTASRYDLVLRAPRVLSTLETGKLIRSTK